MANQDHQKTVPYAGPSDKSCPICLEDFEDRAFVNACFHSFCFLCILQWSEVGNTCPLCKTAFTSLIHKVKANDDYEKYNIKSRSIPANQEVSITEARRFRYSTTAVPGRPALPPGHATRHSRYRVRDSRAPAPEERRRAIYRANLWALPIESGDKRPRVRDISANFFRQNPACTHRLVPWLMRELKVVLGGEEHVEFLIQIVLSLIDKIDIEAREFGEHLTPFLHEKTDHFVHEFVTYARCPYDMIAYDKNVKYSVAGGDSWDPEATQVVPPTFDPSGPGPSRLSSAATFEQRIFEELTTTGWDSPPLLLGSNSPIWIEDSSSDEVDPDAVTPPVVRGAAVTPPVVRGTVATSLIVRDAEIAPFQVRGAAGTPPIVMSAAVTPPVVTGAAVRGTVHMNRASLVQCAGGLASGRRSGRVHTSDAILAGVSTGMDVSGDRHCCVGTDTSSPLDPASCLQPRTPDVSLSLTSIQPGGVSLIQPSATVAGIEHAMHSPCSLGSVDTPHPSLLTSSAATCVLEGMVSIHVGLREDSSSGFRRVESTCRMDSVDRVESMNGVESMDRVESLNTVESVERRKQLQSHVDGERQKRRRCSSPNRHSRRSAKGKERRSSFMDDDSDIDSRRHRHHHSSSRSGGHHNEGSRTINCEGHPPVDARVELSPTHSSGIDTHLRHDRGSSPLPKPMYHHRQHGTSPSGSVHSKRRSHHSSSSEQKHRIHHQGKHSPHEQADSRYSLYHHHHSSPSHHHHHHSSPSHHRHHHSSPSHHHHSSPSHHRHHHSSPSHHRHHHSSPSHHRHHHSSPSHHRHHHSSPSHHCHHHSSPSHHHHHHSSPSHHYHHHSSPSHHQNEIDVALQGSTLPSSAVHLTLISDRHEPVMAPLVDELHCLANTVLCLQTKAPTLRDCEVLSETSVPTVSNVGLELKDGHEGRLLEELTLVEARIRENKKQVLKAALKKERIELLRKCMHKEVCVDKSDAIDTSS